MPKIIGDMKLYSVSELSELLDVTDLTIRRYIKEGKLNARRIGRGYKISDEALRDFINSRDDDGRNVENEEEV